MEARRALFYALFESPLGPLWIVSSEKGLCTLIRKASESDFLAEIKNRTGLIPKRDDRRLSRWKLLLSRYFSGKRTSFNEPISFMRGTPFQKRVWRKLSEIPYGEVRTYQWVADQLSLGRAARAVGNACGRNPLPIVVPCHRVVHRDGSLGGYTGGIEIKKRLLAIESGPLYRAES